MAAPAADPFADFGVEDSPTWFVATALSVSIAIIAGIGLIACFLAYRSTTKALTLDYFITARKSIGTFRIGWSFYASAVGAWAISAPAAYADFAGLTGIIAYALSAAIPVFLIAYLGKFVVRSFGDANSFCDFCWKRYGWVVWGFVLVVTLFNMAVGLTAEYTAIASIFSDYVETTDIPIVLVQAIVVTAYTAYGGLKISIITDQFQGTLSILFVAVAAIYLAVQFREELPTPLDVSGPLVAGYGDSGWLSLVSLPISLTAATFYGEYFWQRVWAAETEGSLLLGSVFGASIIVVVVFLLGFGGLIATWAGLPYLDDPVVNNLALFRPFAGSKSSGIGLVLVFLAVVMNESAIDSITNGLVAHLASNAQILMNAFTPGKTVKVWVVRSLVLAINIPILAVAFQKFSLLSLFFVSNLLTSSATFSVVVGVWIKNLDTFGALGSVVASLISTTIYGWYKNGWGEGLGAAIQWTWRQDLNQYHWGLFAVSMGTNIGATLIYCGAKSLLAPDSYYRGYEGSERQKIAQQGVQAEKSKEEAVQDVPMADL